MEQSLLDKIEKIMALQSRAGTIGEASAAAAALQRILTQHNLEMAEVRKRLGRRVESGGVSIVSYPCPRANWLRMLWAEIAKENESRAILTRNGSVSIVAHEGKHETIKRAVDSIVATVNRTAPNAYQTYASESLPFVEPIRSWTNSYKWGFVSGVIAAMKAAKREVVEQHQGGSALVLVQEKEVQEFTERSFGKLSTRSVKLSGSSAYDRGYSEGYAHGGNRKQING